MEAYNPKIHPQLKLIVIGASSVGKTTLIQRYQRKMGSENYKATIGADCMFQTMEVDVQENGKTVSKKFNVQIWDTAGQERFLSLGNSFYRGSDCCILVFDVTEKKTLDDLDNHINTFMHMTQPEDPRTFPFVVVGNKIDRQDRRVVMEEHVNQFISNQDHAGMPHYFVSALNGDRQEKINEIFEDAVRLAWKRKGDDSFMLPTMPEVDLKAKGNDSAGCCGGA